MNKETESGVNNYIFRSTNVLNSRTFSRIFVRYRHAPTPSPNWSHSAHSFIFRKAKFVLVWGASWWWQWEEMGRGGGSRPLNLINITPLKRNFQRFQRTFIYVSVLKAINKYYISHLPSPPPLRKKNLIIRYYLKLRL